MKLRFETKNFSFEVELNQTKTASSLIQHLPLESTVSTWGDEIYFSIAKQLEEDKATMDTKVGDVAYWPKGKCLCVFFGKTPASIDENPRPASEVTVIGETEARPSDLRNVNENDQIKVMIA